MKLFMLTAHDRSRDEVRDLVDAEIAHVAGANGSLGTIGDDDPCDSTMCNCTIITPGGDGEPMMDCDGG